jgi:hydroxymethylbilane synthase
MQHKKITIGTRGSELALIQTEIIQKQLQRFYPEIEIVIKIIKTTGDKNLNPIPLDTTGKGWFTKELDNELIEGKIDMAVHSLKDVPVEMHDQLVIAAVSEREDPREALILKENILYENMKNGAVIGTDSIRRKAQLSEKSPDLCIKSIRGNVNSRLQKLDNGEYDGILLAAAGLKRLGLTARISYYFSVTDLIPSPGQGALAMVTNKNNKNMIALLKKLNHNDTEIAVRAERAFSNKLGGGCTMPIGAYSEIQDNKIILHGFMGSNAGKYARKATMVGNIAAPEKLGTELADTFLKQGYKIYDRPKFVVITRPEHISINNQKQIEAIGLFTYFYPSIAIARSNLTKKDKAVLSDLESFDWIVFTSRNGVRFFAEALDKLGIPLSLLKSKKIAAIGGKTADVVKKYGLQVDFMPNRFTTEELAKQMQNITGKKILLARAKLGTPQLTKELENKGASVVDIPIYSTTFIENNNEEFENLLKIKQIFCITFTSPSTVKGFINNIKGSQIKQAVLKAPALSIGPVTTNELIKYGFQTIYTADIYTTDGMITKLQEIVW